MSKTSGAAAQSISPQALKGKLDRGEDVLIVDVREPDEVEGWNIQGSVNIPLDELLAGAPVPRLSEASIVVTVCAAGVRSAQAQRHLAGRGAHAVSLEGGMIRWNGVYDVARVAEAPEGADVFQLRRVGKGCLSYMIVHAGEAAVIDPTADVDEYIGLARAQEARITAVLDTHAHADHVSGGQALARAMGATYHVPDEVGPLVAHAAVKNGAPIRVGGIDIVALATPGHTPSSTTYRLDRLAFTGDTLFVESVGRPDLGQDPSVHAKVLWRTLHEKVLTLSDETVILPGHHGPAVETAPGEAVSATLGRLRERLDALRLDEAAFVAWVVRNQLPKPENFETIKKMNRGEVPLGEADEVRELEAGANRCAVSG